MKIIHFCHFDSDPRFPPFLLYVIGGNLGSLLYGDVSVMLIFLIYIIRNILIYFQNEIHTAVTHLSREEKNWDFGCG